MSPHALVLELQRKIRDRLLYNDGHNRPCLGNTLSPQWVAAVASNLAMSICADYDIRPNAVHGEIETQSPDVQAIAIRGLPDDDPPPVRCRAVWHRDSRTGAEYGHCKLEDRHPGNHLTPEGTEWEPGGLTVRHDETAEAHAARVIR